MNHDGSNVASLYGNGCLLLYWHKTPVFGAVESSSRRRDNFKVFFAHLSCIKAGGSIWKKTYEEHDKIVLYSIRSYIIIALANILSMWNYICVLQTDWLFVHAWFWWCHSDASDLSFFSWYLGSLSEFQRSMTALMSAVDEIGSQSSQEESWSKYQSLSEFTTKVLTHIYG